MSDATKLIAILLIVILVISLWALISRKNIKQKIKIPGAKWSFQSSDSEDQNNQISTENQQKTGVEFGEQNVFNGSVGDIAGGDIIKADEMNDSEEKNASKSTGVNFGKSNRFKGNVGDVAGGNIVKKNDTKKRK